MQNPSACRFSTLLHNILSQRLSGYRLQSKGIIYHAACLLNDLTDLSLKLSDRIVDLCYVWFYVRLQFLYQRGYLLTEFGTNIPFSGQ